MGGGLILALLAGMVWSADEVKYTNRDSLSFKGTSEPQTKVKVYVNGKEFLSTQADTEGTWTAKNVPMSEQLKENVIYAKSFSSDGSESPYSKTIRVIVDKIPPEVSVKVGPEKVKSGEKLRVLARISEVADSVTAIMPDSTKVPLSFNAAKNQWEGVWTLSQRLPSGTYQIECIAIDRAGNAGASKSNMFMIDNGAGLSIVTPKAWAFIYEDKVVVQGIATALPYVEINGIRVLVRSDNTFAGEVALPKPGQNKITVIGQSLNGDAQTAEITVVKLITFPDIQTHWARREIEFLATLGYVDAYKGTGLFYPDQTVPREDMAVVLVRAKNFPVGSSLRPTFKDMFENHQAYGAVEAGHQYGLLTGYPDKAFHPSAALTRAEAATVLDRFVDFPLMKAEQPPALDVPKEHWASGYIYTFQRNNLLPPPWKGEMRFYPEMPIKRSEFTAALARTPQVNRAIAQMINRNPEFETVVDSVAFGNMPTSDTAGGMLPYAAGTSAVALPIAASQDLKNARLLKIRVSPVEVRPGTSIMITVVGWRKLNTVQAVAPNDEVVSLAYNDATGRFEGYWKVPNVDSMYGNYTMKIKALDVQGETYRALSNKFAIVAIPEMLVPEGGEVPSGDAGEIFVPGSAEIVFPEYVDDAGRPVVPEVPAVSFAGVSGDSKGTAKPAVPAGSVTNAQFAEFLAQTARFRPSRRMKFVANDVPVSHPQAAQINACLARGLYTLDASKNFKPDAPVSRAFAAVALTRLKKVPVQKVKSTPYTDVPASHWAAGQIVAVVKHGWMTPVVTAQFKPADPLDSSALRYMKEHVR